MYDQNKLYENPINIYFKRSVLYSNKCIYLNIIFSRSFFNTEMDKIYNAFQIIF